MRKIKSGALLLLFAVLLPGPGCRRIGALDEKERNNLIVARAYEMMELGQYEDAVSLFNRALQTYPTLARPHLDLALVLHDHRQRYVRAIYHYERYLELRPGTEKESMILQRIRQAEHAFVAQRVPRAEVSNEALAEENILLRAQLAAARERLTAIEAGGDASRPSREETASVIKEPELPLPAPPAVVNVPPRGRQQREPVGAVVRAPSPPAAEAPRQAPAPSGASVPRTYVVQPGDSLSKIAFRIYGDATQWRAIQEANRETIGDSVNVRSGQQLIIP